MDERLFPELPEDLTALSDEQLAELLARHETVVDLINARDEEFLADLSQDDILAQYTTGVEQIERIVAEQGARVTQDEEFDASLTELGARATAHLASETEDVGAEGGDEGGGGEGDSGEPATAEGDEGGEPEPVASSVAASDEEGDVGEELTATEAEAPLVAVASDGQRAGVAADGGSRRLARARRMPPASPERTPAGSRAALVAAAGVDGFRPGEELDRLTYARACETTAKRWGHVVKHDGGVEQRVLVASASFRFPPERQLHPQDWEANSAKIADVVPASMPGVFGLVASGGLCAPLEPIYSMPNFASQARPLRNALPSFQAERGGVNVPSATSIGNITTAISVIDELEDTLGGTYGTKSCQTLDCPAYTEVPVTIIAHCREYGNLNSRAWPEKIAHENDLTMAAHARSAEAYLFQRIKVLSINVTTAQVLGAYADLVDALLRERASITSVLRMDPGARFRVLMPFWVADLLADDVAQAQFERYQSQAQMVAHLSALGFEVTLMLDAPELSPTQQFAAETASVADTFPTSAEIAIFPEGEFIHVDSGVLELGIVRDSTLNSHNDHQLFGESFENVARLGPAQGARWLIASVCPSGEFPSTSAARC